MKDISGWKFHHLTALYPTEKRDTKGFVIWHCQCDCGNEIDCSYNALMYTNLRSCGCKRKDHQQNLHESLTHIAGTSVDALKSTKTPKNNTTGVKACILSVENMWRKSFFRKNSTSSAPSIAWMTPPTPAKKAKRSSAARWWSSTTVGNRKRTPIPNGRRSIQFRSLWIGIMLTDSASTFYRNFPQNKNPAKGGCP